MPLAEFAANNHIAESTGVTPFYANLGRHPRFLGDQLVEPERDVLRGPQKLDENDARDFATRMSAIHAKLRQELALAQSTQTDAANSKR